MCIGGAFKAQKRNRPMEPLPSLLTLFILIFCVVVFLVYLVGQHLFEVNSGLFLAFDFHHCSFILGISF